MFGLCRKRRDDIPKRKKTLINLNTLLHHFPINCRQRLPLRPRQIHYLQLRQYHIIRIIIIDLFHSNAEYGMRPTTIHVHFMAAENLVFYPMVEQHDDVVVIGDFYVD